MALVFNSIMFAAETASPGGLGAIGIDLRIMIFQLINFAILLWVLKKVAFKPVMKVLNDRRQRIEESLTSAKEIEKSREQMAKEQAELLQKARIEAEAISARARTDAAVQLKQAEESAAKRTQQMLQAAEQRIDQEIAEVKIGLKREVMSLVVVATEAVIREKLDERKDADLLERALSSRGKE